MGRKILPAGRPSLTPSGRFAHTAVWADTTEEMIIWGGEQDDDSEPCNLFWGGPLLNSGWVYHPATDTWRETPDQIGDNAPAPRDSHTAVWAEAPGKMIVWGGFGEGILRNDGGRYDPALDLWAGIPTITAPAARSQHTAAWARELGKMIIWGGAGTCCPQPYYNDGALYDPVANTWSGFFTVPFPGRVDQQAVWTGKELVVAHGYWQDDTPPDPIIYEDSTFRYNPATGITTEVSAGPYQPNRIYDAAVWTGTEMLLWSGVSKDYSTDCSGYGWCIKREKNGAALRVPASYYGDRDNDGRVDGADLGILSRSFGLKPGEAGYDPRADIFGPDGVDAYDLTLLTDGFGQRYTCP